ncbi:insulin-induced gene 2 protein isoform X2 [Mesoplodon densirostris]|uniref:insulin-induced gene 2 protein isoform X2 n=1 Tax=Mesoplodon densirostris TaxID=48708 RepID=UPI0028DB0B61|nr:insulin-induced gene 2 protein isoform X2 [Mesoplodon densirostris]
MAEGETQSPGPKKCGPYISSVTSRSVNLMIRGVVLFFIGVFLALVLNLLQIQRNVTLFPPDVIASIFSSAWWVPPCCGTASAVIGLLYPCIDRHLGEPHKFKREWSSVMRCVAVFVGINHASAKVDFDNNIQLSLTLAALSIGLWWTFDRSRSGFGLGIGIAFLATLVTQLLVYNGVYQYTSPDFLYVRSWLPCIFFAGGITMGNIGRQLAMKLEILQQDITGGQTAAPSSWDQLEAAAVLGLHTLDLGSLHTDKLKTKFKDVCKDKSLWNFLCLRPSVGQYHACPREKAGQDMLKQVF